MGTLPPTAAGPGFHPIYFPPHKHMRSDSHRSHTVPQSGSHLLSLMELLLALRNEVQRETLPVFSWVGTSSWPNSAAPTARMEGGVGGRGGVYFLQNPHPIWEVFGVLLLTTSFGACYMQRTRTWPLWQTWTLAVDVHVLLPWVFSVHMLDPKNLGSGIWMQLEVKDLAQEGVLILPAPWAATSWLLASWRGSWWPTWSVIIQVSLLISFIILKIQFKTLLSWPRNKNQTKPTKTGKFTLNFWDESQ